VSVKFLFFSSFLLFHLFLYSVYYFDNRYILYRNSFFRTVLWVEKYFRHSTSAFIFVYKQTSSVIICSDWPITVELFSRFPARNWTCSIRRRFLAPEKSGTREVRQTDQFLVPVDWYQLNRRLKLARTHFVGPVTAYLLWVRLASYTLHCTT